MAYLTAAQKALIAKKVRGSRYNTNLILDEVAAAIAADLLDVQSANVEALDLTASGTYSSTQIQSIADKVDEIISAMVTSGLMASDESV